MKYIKLFEDLNKAKSVIKRKMENYEKLKVLLQKHQGYIGKFTEYLFDESVTFSSLVELYKKLLDLRDKNIVIDINLFNYEKLLDEIEIKYKDFKVKSVLKNIPLRIRKDFSVNSYTVLFLKFYDSPNKEGFYKKIGRFTNMEDLLKSMKIFLNTLNDTRESVIERMKKTNCQIVLDRENLFAIHTPTCNDLNIMASDTLWCIKSQSQFDRYTKGNGKQYILYDFNQDNYSPLRKIGITIKNNSFVSACHDTLDATVSWMNLFHKCNLKIDDFIIKQNNEVEEKFSPELFKLINANVSAKNLCRIGYLILQIPEVELKDKYISQYINLFNTKVSTSKFSNIDVRTLFKDIAIYHFKTTTFKYEELSNFLPKRGSYRVLLDKHNIKILDKSFINNDNLSDLKDKIELYGLSIFDKFNKYSIKYIIDYKDKLYCEYLLKCLNEYKSKSEELEENINLVLNVLIYILYPEKRNEVIPKISDEIKYESCFKLQLPVDLSNSTEYLNGFSGDISDKFSCNLNFLVEHNLLIAYTKYGFPYTCIKNLKEKLGDNYEFYIKVSLSSYNDSDKYKRALNKYFRKIFNKNPITVGEYKLDNIIFNIVD